MTNKNRVHCMNSSRNLLATLTIIIILIKPNHKLRKMKYLNNIIKQIT